MVLGVGMSATKVVMMLMGLCHLPSHFVVQDPTRLMRSLGMGEASRSYQSIGAESSLPCLDLSQCHRVGPDRLQQVSVDISLVVKLPFRLALFLQQRY